FKIYAAKNHLAQLVRITKPHNIPSFSPFHHLLAFAFIIIAFWIIGRYRISTMELWVRLRPYENSPNALGDPQAFFSSPFQPTCSFLPSSVHALSQTPNT
ncbi:hypothetical protein H5410_061604, partial [Solanum commersonii]